MVMVVIIVLVQVVMNDDDTHLPVRRMEEGFNPNLSLPRVPEANWRLNAELLLKSQLSLRRRGIFENNHLMVTLRIFLIKGRTH